MLYLNIIYLVFLISLKNFKLFWLNRIRILINKLIYIFYAILKLNRGWFNSKILVNFLIYLLMFTINYFLISSNLILFNDAPECWEILFQDSATNIMEEIDRLHGWIYYYETIIFVITLWILISILSKYTKNDFRYKYHNHGTLIEVLWICTPVFIYMPIAFTNLILLLYLINKPINIIYCESDDLNNLIISDISIITDTSNISIMSDELSYYKSNNLTNSNMTNISSYCYLFSENLKNTIKSNNVCFEFNKPYDDCNFMTDMFCKIIYIDGGDKIYKIYLNYNDNCIGKSYWRYKFKTIEEYNDNKSNIIKYDCEIFKNILFKINHIDPRIYNLSQLADNKIIFKNYSELSINLFNNIKLREILTTINIKDLIKSLIISDSYINIYNDYDLSNSDVFININNKKFYLTYFDLQIFNNFKLDRLPTLHIEDEFNNFIENLRSIKTNFNDLTSIFEHKIYPDLFNNNIKDKRLNTFINLFKKFYQD